MLQEIILPKIILTVTTPVQIFELKMYHQNAFVAVAASLASLGQLTTLPNILGPLAGLREGRGG